jgi:8-oxo-dGTP pyrophosphatase MutT (NUDIX family)
MLSTKHGKKRKWGFPGGKVKKKEHPTIGMLREVKEETGLGLMNLTSEKVLKDINHHIHVYRSSLYATSDIKLSKEHTDFQWINKNKIRTLSLNRPARIIMEGNVI